MQENQLKLLKKFDNSILGLIWITKEPLSARPFYFEAIDYLLDGMLTVHNNRVIDNEDLKQNSKSFFIGTSFGKPIFISHLVESSEKLKKDAFELTQLASKSPQDRSSFIILESAQVKLSQQLSSKFLDFKFIQLKGE
ncbi:MAG: hypothetical protein HN576_12865 [Bacteriovoracaceae bacterium]|jgi:hypothetical protein|nr:hypothetical protein [Bacteriovoracaceae bacterium]